LKFGNYYFYINFGGEFSIDMANKGLFPDYIFESSWEVCNKVGGIYAVLSTRARTLHDMLGDNLIFIGPDCWKSKPCPYFKEDNSLFKAWHEKATSEGLSVKIGRWAIPGEPIAILVNFDRYYQEKDRIYGQLWEDFKVDSLHAYGDYDEASMFSYAAALVVQSFYYYNISPDKKVVYHGNEWMTGLGLLYIHKQVPEIATIFTTHATSIGRSIAGNNKPLYDYFKGYNGNQMAEELNMQSKHSIEHQTAKYVDCFTTVSEITARECKQLLDKPVDVVLPNGFENDFVPKGATFTRKRKIAREKLLAIANAMTGENLDDNTMIVSTSGRYEFRNKGIDVFIDAMNLLRHDDRLKRNVVAFIDVPAWVREPRKDLQQRLEQVFNDGTALDTPVITHWLNNMDQDSTLSKFRALEINNAKNDRVKIIFIPCYLTGDDGIVNLSYYDLLLGNDLCVFPSYYEPWGYTPLESIAFKVPCVTTDLAGFGLWINSELGRYGELADGVKVVHRTDSNYADVANAIEETVYEYSEFSAANVKAARTNAEKLSRKALWRHFIKYYEQAYDFALRKAAERASKV
jgi:glycosyltransferase involved in cell wall biosynthesis